MAFYVLPMHRAAALPLFRRLAAASQAKRIEAQTNDVLLTRMLFDCAVSSNRDEVLFHDAVTTNLSVLHITFRRVAEADKEQILGQKLDGDADWILRTRAPSLRLGGFSSTTTSRMATSTWR